MKPLVCGACAVEANPPPSSYAPYLAALADSKMDGLDHSVTVLCERHRKIYEMFVRLRESENDLES